MAASSWNLIECSASQLCLNTVLVCGQSFRWKQNGLGEWLGVIAGHVWRLKQSDGKIQYKVYTSACKSQSMNNTDAARPQLTADKTPLFTGTSSQLKLPSEQNRSNKKKLLTTGNVENNPRVGAHRLCRNTVKACSESNSKTQKASNEPLLETDISTETQNSSNRWGEKEQNPNTFSQILHDYFQLEVDLETMYKEWSTKDPHFSKVASHFKGIRMLRQDPVENLLSFVCSSNNHISRISSMVEKLCTHYGNYITTVDGDEYYDFPSLSALCGDDVEPHLRELGFGYRAKFIASIAKHVTQEKGGDDWVRSLRGRSYLEAKSELMSLLGVGAKVADCVCLMSLDQPGAIPVDTHVWQITLKHYMAKLNTAKSLTDKIYNEIGEFYRNLWGPYAGWAHSVLFAADLRQNKERAALVGTDSKTEKKKQGKVSLGKRPSEKSCDYNTKVSKTRIRNRKK
ncbi:N-glycosylase/DNA lyase [Elysia marginata]|uniref:N-glycosylase/DNA lyase n=1 Tax=Elysia marginata TaxID=1093978 RepID=A0AAV4JN78_9GAST|nr:N-glycosylase/DNA lyase [Elysia marginata]